MKLKFDVQGRTQPDPFVFRDGDKFYLYCTGYDGVEAYSADDVFGMWHYEGIVTEFRTGTDFWAPSVIKIDGTYYMYVSFRAEECGISEFMHVAKASSPLGPFREEKMLYPYFSIDSHAVKTEEGIYLFFAANSERGERIGTRIFVDRLLDPYTPENNPEEIILPTFDEEFFILKN